LCPSVVILNKTITRAESFIIVTWALDLSLRNVVFGVTLRLLVIILRRFPPSTNSAAYPRLSVINSPWSVAAKRIALAAGTVHSTQ